MIWTVTYLPTAEAELTRLWLASSARNDLARASDEVERQLRSDPLHAGQELGDHYWIIVEGPVAVLYQVDEPDCRVSVKAVFDWTVEEGS